jgi:hypothetical protein
MTAYDAAVQYLERGYIPIPVPRRQKAPVLPEWQKLKPSPEQLATLFHRNEELNIGLLLGEPSGGLIDIDLDAPEAVAAAPHFLPSTGWVSGRAGKPRSHWWYCVAEPPAKAADQYRDLDAKKTMIVELRSTGGQTVVPPSVHESGECIIWHDQSQPAEVDLRTLRSAVRAVAACAILARHWPGTGSRQDAFLALAGGLARIGWDSERVRRFVNALATVTGDEEREKRLDAAGRTMKKQEVGDATTGWTKLANLLSGDGARVIGLVRTWCGETTSPAEAGRPTILITPDEHRVNDEAIAALSDVEAAPEVYQRGGKLVTVRRDPTSSRIDRRPEMPRVAVLSNSTVRELLTRVARFETNGIPGKQSKGPVAAHPPSWCVAAISERGNWPRIRRLEGVIEAPTIRPDSSILDEPGWDRETGLLYEPAGAYPPIPEKPEHDHARAAAEELLELVCDFPFAGEAHRAAWLAALLTALARPAVAGPCPLFLLDGNSPGSGKSMLADLVSVVVTGREMSRTSYPDSDDEMRKRITSVALAGDRFVLLDNIVGLFGGAALDAALTGVSWRDRILGRSEMTSELPLHTVWFATGVNVTLRGDVQRRIVPSRLETRLEKPEERTGFRYPDLLAHVRRERPRLVCAGLTLLRAFALAGRPQPSGPPFGGFDGWASSIRAAVAWATGVDPCATREMFRAADPTLNTLRGVLAGWRELPGAEEGLSVATALELLTNPVNARRYTVLRTVLLDWSANGELPSPNVIGCRLRKLRGGVADGMMLQSEANRTGLQIWRVVRADEG